MVTTDAMLKKLESAVDTCMEAEFAKDEIMAEFHKADWFNEGYFPLTRVNANSAQSYAPKCIR
ncbi:hypothetical protein [Brenneria uluponensis]|uniref:hypothetical protein n=1 Tax=Brenneria uluponensis TaxID=3057057 RepID=UPI0028EDA8C1|nr:hypothetical protein [Brenneria ulupoensis]